MIDLQTIIQVGNARRGKKRRIKENQNTVRKEKNVNNSREPLNEEL